MAEVGVELAGILEPGDEIIHRFIDSVSTRAEIMKTEQKYKKERG
jgi:hypothetical protein